MSTSPRQIAALLTLALAACLSGCGGGQDTASPHNPSLPGIGQPFLIITTDSSLPGTLVGHRFSVPLTAINGQGALRWSITSPPSAVLTELAIDSNGVLSALASSAGNTSFNVQVADSSSPPRLAEKSFVVQVFPRLAAGPDQSFTLEALQEFFGPPISVQGGVPPLTFRVTGGSLPQGIRLNRKTGQLHGSALTTGISQFMVTIRDSFSPAEVVSKKITLSVIPAALSVAQNSIPSVILLNRPFSGRVVAFGGVPPYSYLLTSGRVPLGLSDIDPHSGQTSGTPNTAGRFLFSVRVTDSASPPNRASMGYHVTVSPPIGRNDTPATATAVESGTFLASLSPYIDPPDSAPLAADNDYYKVSSLGGSTVHLEAGSAFVNPLDTVLEVVDGNGVRFSTCRQPGDNTENFASACVNDDRAERVLDSALDFRVPGPGNALSTFFVRVLDWRGDARPDMSYHLRVSGAVQPFAVQKAALIPGARGRSYNQHLSFSNGEGPVSWSLVAGTLPAGLSLHSGGGISGTPTALGSSTFTLRVVDSSNPARIATAEKTIQIVEPVRITSSATLPDACVNRRYTFAMQAAGGAPPVGWFFDSALAASIWVDPFGVLSGFPELTGTFTARIGVVDATTHGHAQTVSLTVKQCP